MRGGRTINLLLACGLLVQPLFCQHKSQDIVIDATAQTTPFPHYWEQMFGSGRAILTLRESYREDLRSVQKVTDMRYVRFHGILLDEVGVYDEDKHGRPHYNFSYVDQIYDGLLKNNVRPFVELSFMPEKLASADNYQSFWYRPIVSPPKGYAKWDDLITHLVQHLVERYGITEVSQWYFEVWNEPNIAFWTGDPPQQTYFELYDHTARDIKAVDSRLRVGGPSTAQAAWIDAFIAHVTTNHVPVDFISSHIYGMDTPEKIFGTNVAVSPDDMVCAGTKKMHDEIAASAQPKLPLIVSEFSSLTVKSETRDTLYMGPWLAHMIRDCDGLAETMSFWPLSDVFEEHGVPQSPFPDKGSAAMISSGRGLIALDHIPKPSYVAFALLHRLGDERLLEPAGDVLVTKRKDGSLVIALWNLVDPGEYGASREIHLKFDHLPDGSQAVLYRLDKDHGDTLDAYRAMGSPRYPSLEQVNQLRKIATVAPVETRSIENSEVTLTIPAEGLAVMEVITR